MVVICSLVNSGVVRISLMRGPLRWAVHLCYGILRQRDDGGTSGFSQKTTVNRKPHWYDSRCSEADMPKIPSAYPNFSAPCDARLPQLALQYRLDYPPPLTTDRLLNGFNVTVWLYQDKEGKKDTHVCLLYTSPSPRDGLLSRM